MPGAIAVGERDTLPPVAFLPRLEALGLMRWFDRLVVGRTIDALRADPAAVYGCNVAAASAVVDDAWLAIFRRLEREPSVRRGWWSRSRRRGR